ncbi:MAG: ABC transporter permease [Rhodocyclaceae bacterium]|nr:ABC transporter permease [Rhodocyclaceae bacterium]
MKQIEQKNPSPYLRIDPPGEWSPVSLGELWQHRDLLTYLVLRDVRALTSSTQLGFLWIVIHPLSVAVVLIVVLGMFVKIPTGGTPYALIVLSGLMSWNYVSNAITRSSSSMLANAYLITKVYFPRLIIPIVPVISGLIELGVMVLITASAAVYFGVPLQFSWLFLLAAGFVAMALATGVGLWFSALTVRYRDFSHAIPVIMQIGFYASPVLYPITLVPEKWRQIYDLNPLVGIVELTRWSLFGEAPFPTFSISTSIAWAVMLIATGVFYFRATEDVAADLV